METPSERTFFSVITVTWLLCFWKLLRTREMPRFWSLLALWALLTPAIMLAFASSDSLEILALHLLGCYLYLNVTAWLLYRGALTSRWQEACEHLRLVTALKHYPQVIKVTKNYFRINARAFKAADFEDKRSELSSYLKCYIREIKQTKRIDLLDIYYSKKDLPEQIPFKPDCNFGQIILGFGSNGFFRANLHSLIHIGIAGLPGSGKSVMLRGLITQIMLNYSKSVIIGIDFKQGSEFHIFEYSNNFVLCDDHETTSVALNELFAEYKRRAEFIKRANKENSYQIIGPNKERIHPAFVIIDEAAEFFSKEKSEAYQQSTALVNKLARLARFVGIHLIIATQRPDTDAIPQQVRGMLKTRICFKLRQKEDSIMFVGTAAATNLADVPGRFLLAADDGTFAEMQGMWLSKESAKTVLTRTAAKRQQAQLFVRIKSQLTG